MGCLLVSMNNKYPLFIRLIPMLVVMGIIFILSHQPGDELELPSIPYLDKAAHFVVYGVLAMTISWVPSAQFKQARPLATCAIIVLLCLGYGMTDEYHQSFISGRFVSVGDVIADVGGALTFCFFWLRRHPAMQ